MKKIILFDTSIASPNKGDDIIVESCEHQLQDILKNNYVFHVPTHTPMSHWYQNFSKFNVGDWFRDIDYKFICGTNILNANMFLPMTLWNVNLFNCKIAKGSIAVGVGMGSKKNRPNLYTRRLLKSILSEDYIHSTRDDRSADFLRELGLKAVNTGCITTWGLSNEVCGLIPKRKTDKVVFTLTDYAKNRNADKKLIEILLRNYNEVYFWIQGVGDLEYLDTIYSGDKIKLIEPSLDAYQRILGLQPDYVGTRLHAGIKAMQCMCRSIILTVDNRTEDMKKSINLHCIGRNNIEKLELLINEEFDTSLNIKEDNIKLWKEQFD
ncbi:polysaccharide pyruvyl transferase family protein [Clostridium sp. AF15-17LB]|nr:polysaccharide pyruvyl transferase family protein [Clostridium sp. AF15-17LB]